VPEPAVAFYGDDFTGSVDALLQFTRAGLTGRLFVGRPELDALRRAAAEVDVVGIAGIARSLPAHELDEEVRDALVALHALGAGVVQYKACSTADSSPTIGSLGRVVEIAREIFGPASVPALFAQPDFGRYTVFGQHFAAEGDRVYRLDRQPTMSNHPVTPMHEADLALHLSRQTDLNIGSLHLTAYSDAADVTRALRQTPDAATVLDALTDDHVTLVGRAVWDLRDGGPVFAVGSGGLSTGLGRATRGGVGGSRSATAREVGVGIRPAGPVLAVSGSRSPQTARQIEHASAHGWASFDLPLGEAQPAGVLQAAVLNELAAGRSVVVSTAAAELGEGAAADAGGTIERIAGQLAQLVAAALASGSTGRVIVCGGDTSSRLVTLLGAESLLIAANPFDNVVLCRVSAPEPSVDGAEMLLKGGQVGPVNLFETIRQLS